MTKRIFLALCVLTSTMAFGQGACYPAGVVLLDTGRPANGASVRVCTAGSSGTPCTPGASLFTDPTLGTPLGGSPVVITDARGNFGFCAAAGSNYDLQISGTGITTLNIKNLPLPPTTPITASSLTSSSSNPANVGVVKLASGDCLDWRNNANSGNIQLCKTGAAAGGIPADTFDMTAAGAVEAKQVIATLGGGGSSSGLQVAASNAAILIDQTAGGADAKLWDFATSTNVLLFRAVNDASNNSNTFMTVNRSGFTIGAMSFGAGGGVQTLPTTTGTLARTSGDTFTSTTLTSPVINGTPTGTGIPAVTLKKGSGGGTYSSSSLSYVQVDATNLLYTVTIPSGWKLLINSSFRAGTSTAAVAWFVALADGGSVVVETTGLAVSAGNVITGSLSWAITGDGASHTIDLRFKTSAGADAVIIGNGSATDVPTMTFLLTPSN